jgi:two-component system OmpR family response regulator
MKLLVIEDDQPTADYLCRALAGNGHEVMLASDGKQGLAQAFSGSYDTLIIDRMLPGLDGVSIVKELRIANINTPILLLTTMSGLDDRVEGLESGADDYLVKPFAMPELLARLNALARRSPAVSEPTTLRRGDLEVDLLKRDVRRGGIALNLQPQEFKLLEYLLRSDGKIVTRTMLLENVWGFHFDPQTTVVETHMSRLRAKLDKGHDTSMIITQRGIGYRFVA